MVDGRVRGREGGWLTDVKGGGEGERDGNNGKEVVRVSGEWLDLTTELTT